LRVSGSWHDCPVQHAFSHGGGVVFGPAWIRTCLLNAIFRRRGKHPGVARCERPALYERPERRSVSGLEVKNAPLAEYLYYFVDDNASKPS
jgi:hypothetical protein